MLSLRAPVAVRVALMKGAATVETKPPPPVKLHALRVTRAKTAPPVPSDERRTPTASEPPMREYLDVVASRIETVAATASAVYDSGASGSQRAFACVHPRQAAAPGI